MHRLEEDTLLIKELLHWSDEMPGEQSTRRGRVGESSGSDISSRKREINPVDEFDKRFLCVLEESNVNPLEEESSTTPLKEPIFEHEPSEDTMVDYARDLAFLPDLTKFTPT